MPKIINQSSNYDYKVATRPLYDLTQRQLEMLNKQDEEAVFAGVYGNFRNEVDPALGIVTERYALAQNGDVVNTVDDACEKIGLKNVERDFRVVDDGRRFYARYTLKDKKYNFNIGKPKVGDNVGVSFTIQNSFDCTKRLQVALGFLRLVCSNGMTSLTPEYECNFRHQSGIDIGSIGSGIENALGQIDSQREIFQRLANTKIDHEKGQNILNNLQRKNIVSGNVRDNIAAIWDNPAHDEDNERNLWNLYNAATQHITRVIEPKRFEQANRLGRQILVQLDKASGSKKVLTTLAKGAKVENN
jgi:hypothetical protein